MAPEFQNEGKIFYLKGEITMFVKTITYQDFLGNERTEDFYFNLTEAEIIEWLSTNAEYTLDKVIENMTKKMNVKGILEATKSLIYKAYGEVSLDGRRFIKSEEVKNSFMETNAYSVLFMELATDAKKAAAFFNSIIPKDLAETVNKLYEENPNATPEELIAKAREAEPVSSQVQQNVSAYYRP